MTDDDDMKETPADATPPGDSAGSEPAQEGADPIAQLGDTAQTAEAELFPKSDAEEPSDADRPEGEVERHDSDVEEARPFATSDAPWVGAERKWLAGEEGGAAGTGHETETEKDDLPPWGAKPKSPLEDDDELLLSPQIPVLPSLIPPPRSGMGTGAKIGIIAAVIVALGAGAMVWWMNQRFAEREQEILAMRASDKQDVVRLESQIRELLAEGGAANQQRASELQVKLDAAKMGINSSGSEVVDGETEEERRHRRERDSDGREAPPGDVAATAEPATPYDEPTAATAPAGTAGAKSPDDEDLLASAFTKPAAAAAETPAPAPIQGAAEFPLGGTALPQSPSRDQVKSAMDAIAPQVKKCGEPGGRVVVSLAVAGATGRVLSAEPTGDAAGTPLGLCAARAVKLAKFPAFQQDRLQIKYPFDL